MISLLTNQYNGKVTMVFTAQMSRESGTLIIIRWLDLANPSMGTAVFILVFMV